MLRLLRRPRRTVRSASALLIGLLVAGCGGNGRTDPAADASSQPPPPVVAPVRLGTPQQVQVASSFGPGTTDVRVTIAVYAVRDHVAPDPSIRPAAASSHWASADVQICRDAPVVLGYPAWVLGDDQGRTAQVTKILHPQFPQPPLLENPPTKGCSRGWVTWVTADDLLPTQVRFEQTHGIPGAWRIHA